MHEHLVVGEKPRGARSLNATVVVCVFALRRIDQAVDCVRSVLDQDPPPGQTLVVVDHNEPLRAKLRARLPEEVEIVANEGARGLSSARNTAIRRCRGEYIVFIDDDAIAHEQWLASLLTPFSDAAVVGTGGHARPLWETRAPGWLPPELLWVVGCSYGGLPATGAVRNPLGCNMAFRADLFHRVGMFNPGIGRLGNLPLGCEETEFCLRAARDAPDARIVLTTGAEIDHRVPAARARPSYVLRRCFFEGVSKALVRRLGDRRSLATERSYLRHALPRRLRTGVQRALTGHGMRDSAGQVGAVLGSVAAATAGYVVGVIAFGIRPPAGVAAKFRDRV
jgi:glycosyltransferase involved in cell wall biosynthesis